MNTFLNNAHHYSQKPRRRPATPGAKPRHAIRYLHTRECDVFYDLSVAGLLKLPQPVRDMLDARHINTKVRTIMDQTTGNTIAQTIKVRVADLDVYSPNTELDYRVSVNIEAKVEGDWRKLVQPRALRAKRFERKKDRVSFRHLAYSIDLTTVSSPDVSMPATQHPRLILKLTAAGLKCQRAGGRGFYGGATQAWQSSPRRPAQRVQQTG